MKACITKSLGDYILRYKSSDLERIKALAWWVKEWYGIDYTERL